jgi:hypothetical protein
VLSVVITVVEGDPTLSRCIDAVSMQAGSPDLEIIVPFDAAIPEVAKLADRLPHVRFVDAGTIPDAPIRNAFNEHALYEHRRAAGLRAANGRLIALLEDRGVPQSDWATGMIQLHASLDAGAIGGVVAHGGRGPLRWALFLCDFGRYQPCVAEGPVEYLSDVNICYKREAIESLRHLWSHKYQESTVNWALRRAGDQLYLSRLPVVVEQRAVAGLWPAMKERIHWARIFAHVRGRETPSRWRRLLWAAVTPVLPLVLFSRHLRRQLGSTTDRIQFATAIPALLLLLYCWSLGECIGYCEAAFARPEPRAIRPSEHPSQC